MSPDVNTQKRGLESPLLFFICLGKGLTEIVDSLAFLFVMLHDFLQMFEMR